MAHDTIAIRGVSTGWKCARIMPSERQNSIYRGQPAASSCLQRNISISEAHHLSYNGRDGTRYYIAIRGVSQDGSVLES